MKTITHPTPPTATAGIPTAPVSLPRGGEFLTCRLPSPRPAFTLVELLVVIVILAMLASLVTVASSRAMTAARNAAIKAEIDMLHMAIMNYKNEYGSFPPCYDDNPSAPLNTGVITSVAQKHLQKLFPRCTNVSGAAGQFAGSVTLTPANALAAWLSGYTSDPTSPLSPAAGRQKLFDFDQSRMASTDKTNTAALLASRLVYYPSGKPDSPYIYIVSGTTPIAYGAISAPSSISIDAPLYVTKAASVDTVSLNFTTVSAERKILATGTTFFNPDTFQILSPGRDGILGNDDDLSNFWPGTRKDYLDSLNQ